MQDRRNTLFLTISVAVLIVSLILGLIALWRPESFAFFSLS